MTAIFKSNAPIGLDWSRLLGFDQITERDGRTKLTEAGLVKLGAKPGNKPN